MNEFWTEKKLGKHPNVQKEAERLYEHYALCDADKLLARLKQSNFKFGNVGPYKWSSFLENANLDDCLKPEYVKEALEITTAQPAIGKGEFLFVSVFNNVGFADHAGDLIDLNTNALIEVKGKNASLGNGQSKMFKALDMKQVGDVYHAIEMQRPNGFSKFDSAERTVIKEKIGTDMQKLRNVLTYMQNTTRNYIEHVNVAYQVFLNTKRLDLSVAAMHLYAYMSLSKINYLLAVNNDIFRCFKAPRNAKEALDIIKCFYIDEWRLGKSGTSITLR